MDVTILTLVSYKMGGGMGPSYIYIYMCIGICIHHTSCIAIVMCTASCLIAYVLI